MRSKKKILALIAVVILAVGGYGALRYVENSVVKAVRNMEKELTPYVSIGSVQFSLLNKKLTLNDVRGQYKVEPQGVIDYTIRRITATVPLDLLFDTSDASTLVASECAAEDIAANIKLDSATGPVTVTETVKSEHVTNLRVDLHKILPLLRGNTSQIETQYHILANMSYDSATASDFHIQIPAMENTPEVRITMEQMVLGPFRDMEFQSLQSLRMRFLMGGQEKATLDEWTAKGVRMPPLETMKKLKEISRYNKPEEAEEAAALALALVREMFTGPKPLVEQTGIKGLSIDPKGVNIRMSALTVDWPSSRPIKYSFKLADLSLPSKLLLAEVPQLRLPGLDTFTIDMNGSVDIDAKGLDKETLYVAVRDLGTLDSVLTLRTPQNMQGDPALWGFMTQVVNAEATFEDKNLLAYLGGNVDPSGTAAAAALTGVANMALQQLLPQLPPAVQEQIGAFIQRPGTLKVVFAPKEPVAILELVGGLGDFAPALTITATPGTSPLEQQIQKLFAPKDVKQQ